MKRVILLVVAVLLLVSCGAKGPEPVSPPAAENTLAAEAAVPIESTIPTGTEAQRETLQEATYMIRLTIGDETLLAELAGNNTAKELAELLESGPIDMPAYNYGGFEKVCALGTVLNTDDVQTTTQAGDIMLYNANQIVIFYSSNSWAYTRLARVRDEDIPRLQAILSGTEDTVTISLA